jgi:hypothetical protein
MDPRNKDGFPRTPRGGGTPGSSKPSVANVFGGDSPKGGSKGGSGTVNGLPFANANGTVKNPEKVEPYNMNRDGNRPQEMPRPVFVQPGTDVSAMSREQTMGSVEQRVDPRSIPDGGPSIPLSLTPAYRRNTAGSVGSTNKPFRVK